MVTLHDATNKVVSERDAKFTSNIWNYLFVGLGKILAFSKNYHSQTYGKTKEGQQDIGRHVDDVCDASSKDMGGVPSIS